METFWILLISGIVYLVYKIKQNISGKKSTQEKHAMNLNLQVSTREKTASEKKSTDLLKEATQKKNNKDIDGAIGCLREAYKLMEQSSIFYPIDTYLRLPLYLQQAGHYGESQIEFKKLLNNSPGKIAKEFSHISKQEQNSLCAMERASIYDKMQLAAKREKRFSYSAYYKVISNANRAVGLKLQKRGDELDRYRERELWEEGLAPLLKKENKEILIPNIVNKSIEFSRSCTESALEKFTAKIAEILEINHEGDMG